ncbi:MAG: hypothetical protein WDA22_15465 [Bacteroidota bacterium]
MPDTSNKTIEVIEIFKKSFDGNSPINEKYRNKEFGTDQKTENPFESIKSFNDLHPIGKNTYQQLKSEKPDDYSRLVSYGEKTVDIRVSKLN